MEPITRRIFLKRTIGGVGGIVLTNSLANSISSAQPLADMSRVVVATANDLTEGISVNADAAGRTLDAAMKAFTGKSTESEAWRSIFPSLAKDDIIGIKINTLFRLSTHAEVVDAIVRNLVAIGVPENNIIVWDKSDVDLRSSGYQINRGDNGVRYLGTGGDYDGKIYRVGGQSKRLSTIMTQMCDHLINVPVLKDHGTSGVTFSLKNHYGTVDNPGTLHGNNCDPYIAELNDTEPIKEKTRLIILDASLGVYNGGPGGGPQFRYNSLILGQDPVSLDYHCLQIIDEERKKHGLRPVAEVGRPAKHIQTAADMGLGTNDPEKIELIEIEIEAPEEPTEAGKAVNPKDSHKTQWGRIKLQ